jgi:hypothetical protein
MTIFTAVALAVVAFGHNGSQTPRNTSPQNSPGQYPVLFNQGTGHTPRRTEPHPTVSYPIKFDTPKRTVTRPKSAVSYPIDLSTLGSDR